MSVTNSSTEDLPEHVMFEILSRLPVKTIIHCKCVCKKWLDLVSCSYFANLHFSRSPSGIFMHHDPVKEKTRYNPGKLKWLDIEDELRHLDRLHYRDLMSLDLNLSPETKILPVGSVGGLLCLWMWKYGEERASIYISNPITREYINIPLPVPGQSTFRPSEGTFARCFGVGLLTHEYKVVRVFDYENSTSTGSVFEAQVYTLGTGQGQWKSLGLIPYFLLGDSGKFLNGHAHWIVSDDDSPRKLCAFDFDKETFKLFPPPPVEGIQETERHHRSLGVLKGYLCQCDTFDSQFSIWMMKEYGVEKSWELQVIIKRCISPDMFSVMQPPVKPVELLNDGTFLVFFKRRKLVGFSRHIGTIVATKYYHPFAKGLVYRPSFLKLPQL